jgi:methionine sulfoxide reductase catalytic subunit
MSKNKYTSNPVKPSEITPEHLYLNRRKFISTLGITSAAAFLAACSPQVFKSTAAMENKPAVSPDSTKTNVQGTIPPSTTATLSSDEPLTDYEAITNYNNYYEFSLDKQEVAPLSADFKTSPWTIEVGGLVNKPLTLGMEDLTFPREERIYRLRCVEGWSMVIPWLGFPLKNILELAGPTSDAKFVAFQTLNDPEQYPNLKNQSFPWPYTEGLRLDEAMHDLTILSTGLYGKELLPQNGAPLRLVVPWKYGFKSIKSIVKIDLVDSQPATFWNSTAPQEYGFYSNVNPEKSHPRWSQSSEFRIGEKGRRPTLMFNGYAEDVAYLYEGMDLQVDF